MMAMVEDGRQEVLLILIVEGIWGQSNYGKTGLSVDTVRTYLK